MSQSLEDHNGRGAAATRTIDASTSVDNESSNNEGGGTATTPLQRTAKTQRDAKLVRRARATVMTVLLVSAVTVATLAYVILNANENDSFLDQYDSAARQVVVMAHSNVMNAFVSFETLAAVYPSHGKKSNETMPFVTIDDFDAIASRVRQTSKATYIFFKALLHGMDEVEQWNDYAARNQHWIAEGRSVATYGADEVISDEVVPYVFWPDGGNSQVPVNSSGEFYSVSWQFSPVPAILNRTINIDANVYPSSRASAVYVEATGKHSMTEPNPVIRKQFKIPDHIEGPLSVYYVPVWSDVESVKNRTVKGILAGFMAWQSFFEGIFSSDEAGEAVGSVMIVIQSCATSSTFLITGSRAKFIDFGDHHDTKYSHLRVTFQLIEADEENADIQVQCAHIAHVYPTAHLESLYRTQTPKHYAVVVVSIFSFAAAVFVLYDYFVSTRQTRTEQQADKSNAIVQEMFPGDMAARLFESGDSAPDWTSAKPGKSKSKSAFGRLERDTIAELHPDATVLFADISGFTAWSSIRDPHQVFKLLESVFQAFDTIAKRYRVFKVETVGDCYVAVCGVPVPNEMHAVVMCSFARRAMIKFRWVCRSLEMLLGPDTGDLALRIGMHSGPVTGGVLRGDRARFQLFGDTVNTASRIESSGLRERVHLSEQTALQLIKHGKEDWIVKRDDAVEAKGKGKLVTYWLKLTGHQPSPGSVAASANDEEEPAPHQSGSLESLKYSSFEMPPSKSPDEDAQRNERLVQWNSELLLELLQRVVARRAATASTTKATSLDQLTRLARNIGNGTIVVEEVAEIIDMPDFVATKETENDLELSDVIVEQLRAFVSQIAEMYNDNPFHNFEHASHVTMSIHKLLGRIVAPTQLDPNLGSDADREAAYLHDHTCGITSDPLTQFAVVLSGLIHDLDHPGVSNGQLIKENPSLAAQYKEKSVAEQNSVDLAWTILQSNEYADLRAAIYTTETELRRFRSLLVNSVIATDIFDKDQSTLRKNRWNKAFYETTPQDDAHEVKSRKATIVIEHLIQASDVAHTMQHWHVYQKWNQRLFDEMMTAYRAGRSDKDPSEGWYGGELWFFDNYVIPLSRKLKECGVFGVSSDEYLNYAEHNRVEWEAKGKDVVEQYLDEFNRKHRDTAAADAVASTGSANLVTL